MELELLYLKSDNFWTPDYDCILISNQASLLRLDAKASFVFYNLIIKKNRHVTLYSSKNIFYSEIQSIINSLKENDVVCENILNSSSDYQPISF
jgi:hypothetical protein